MHTEMAKFLLSPIVWTNYLIFFASLFIRFHSIRYSSLLLLLLLLLLFSLFPFCLALCIDISQLHYFLILRIHCSFDKHLFKLINWNGLRINFQLWLSNTEKKSNSIRIRIECWSANTQIRMHNRTDNDC